MRAAGERDKKTVIMINLQRRILIFHLTLSENILVLCINRGLYLYFFLGVLKRNLGT